MSRAVLNVLNLLFALIDVGGSDAGVRLLGRGRRWFRNRVSESWPTAQTTVLSGRIQESRNYYVVSVTYSFYTAGDRYGGRYEHEFTTDSIAKDTLQRLLSSPPLVHYKPDHQRGHLEMSQAFGPVAGGDRRDRLTS
jgi:hypothetical protein